MSFEFIMIPAYNLLYSDSGAQVLNGRKLLTMRKWGEFPTGRKAASSRQEGGCSGKSWLDAGSSILATASMTFLIVPGNSDTQAFLGIPKGFGNVVLPRYSGSFFLNTVPYKLKWTRVKNWRIVKFHFLSFHIPSNSERLSQRQI